MVRCAVVGVSVPHFMDVGRLRTISSVAIVC